MRRLSISGFTLIELLVVLAIAGLLMSLVPSLLSAAVPGSRLRIESRDLAADLLGARNRAIATGTTIDFTIGFDPPQYIVGNSAPRELPNGITIAARKDLELQSLHTSAQLRQHPEEKFRTRFYPDGSSSGAVITLRQASQAFTVTVDWLLGSVTVTSGLPDDET